MHCYANIYIPLKLEPSGSDVTSLIVASSQLSDGASQGQSQISMATRADDEDSSKIALKQFTPKLPSAGGLSEIRGVFAIIYNV